jgi:GH3 auxin-responsive promoter
MSSITNHLTRYYLSLRMRRIERFMREPEIAQQKMFEKLMTRGRHTEFGQKHGFEDIRSMADFARRVPVGDYENHKLDIGRMMRGERDILIPGEVNWYSKSSGTTSDKSKFIPAPPLNIYRSHMRASWDSVALMYDMKPDMKIFEKRSLLLPGSYTAFSEYPKTKFGDISAVLTHHMPQIGKMHYAPSREIATLTNFEEKINRTVETCSMQDDIVMFGGVPTWLIVLFRRILEKTGKQNLLEVWPNLQAYMHGGVGFDPYRKTFQELIPSDSFIYQEIYNASEGYFGATSDLSDRSMLLFIDHGVFYEFIPITELDKSDPKTLTLMEVDLDENYALVITSTNGLMRYMPGDTVMFTSKSPYKFKITGRTRQFINAFGEEVMISDTDKAVAQTCEQLDVVVSEYTAGPFYFSGNKGKGGHEWMVEFEKSPTDLARFIQLLDENLQKINSDYEAKRFQSIALDQIRMTVVRSGTFLDWMKWRGKFGNQNKVPRLANDRKTIESLMEFQKSVR